MGLLLVIFFRTKQMLLIDGTLFQCTWSLAIHRKMSDQLAKSWPYVTVIQQEGEEGNNDCCRKIVSNVHQSGGGVLFVCSWNLKPKWQIQYCTSSFILRILRIFRILLKWKMNLLDKCLFESKRDFYPLPGNIQIIRCFLLMSGAARAPEVRGGGQKRNFAPLFKKFEFYCIFMWQFFGILKVRGGRGPPGPRGYEAPGFWGF